MTSPPAHPNSPESHGSVGADTITDPSPPGPIRGALWTTVVMLLLITIPPVTQAVFDWRTDTTPVAFDFFTTRPSRHAFRALEAQIEKRSWVSRMARGAWASWIDGALDRGSAQVVVGRRGWLFYRPSLRFVSGIGFRPEQHLEPTSKSVPALSQHARDRKQNPQATVSAAIVDFHHQLASRGIRLLFVPVPTKPTVYPELVSRSVPEPLSPDRAPNNPSVADLFASLRQSGVEVIDALPTLLEAKHSGPEVYLPTDTHLSWFGLTQVVRLVGKHIGPMRASPSGRTFSRREVAFKAQGDLDRMLRERSGSQTRPGPSEMAYEVLQVVGDREGRPPVRKDAPVMVMGDSSVLVFSDPTLGLGRRAGFAEHLADRLGVPVDLLATPAGGATRIRRLLALEHHRLKSVRVLVWVLTQRDLRFAVDRWHRVSLPEPDSDDPTSTVLSGAVAARVVKVSRPPEQVAYADCLMIVRYQLLAAPEREFDVAHIGWQNFAPAPAARLRPGDRVDLDLTELPGRWQLDRTCWVDDVGLTTMPLWARNHAVR